MGIYTELPDDVKDVDVIIAGGGTAGCIIAARLSAASPELAILVIESGSDGAGNPLIEYPVLFIGNIGPGSTTASFYKSNASDRAAGREVIVPTGNVLGGGSAVNMMAYNRGSRRDWDSWQAPGWSSDEVLPFIKKLETYKGPGKQETHGFEGPITVSPGTFTSTRLQNSFVTAMGKVGWPEIQDINDLESGNGVQRAVRYISPDGKRQDTASKYLRPRLAQDQGNNLHVLVNSKVVRVLVEGGKASGVVYRAASDTTTERTVKATKMVVVSAGAFGTPAILERSGIGSPAVLEKAGVSVVVDLPGVGQNFQDHELVLHAYKSSLRPEETLDKLASGAVDAADMIKASDPMLGWNAQDATCKIRPNEKDVALLGPRFQEAWAKDFEPYPNKPLIMIALVGGYGGPPMASYPVQYFSMSTFTTYPYARGHVHITGPGPDDTVDFEAGLFSDENDVDVLMQRWAYKKQREVARRMDLYRGELPSLHPPFPSDSAAACKDVDGPLLDVQDIVYSAEDDAIIDKWLRDSVGSCWHSQGTCRMAPRDQNGVVDERLNVHGIQGLKLADLSIMPVNVAANTNHTALVIGERAADIIIKDLGLAAE